MWSRVTSSLTPNHSASKLLRSRVCFATGELPRPAAVFPKAGASAAPPVCNLRAACCRGQCCCGLWHRRRAANKRWQVRGRRARLAQNRYMSRPQRAAPSDVARLDQRRRGPHASPSTLRARPPLAHAPTCSPHLRRPRRSARATPAVGSRWQDREEHTRVGTQPSAVGKREGGRTGPRRAVWSGKTCSIPSAEPTCEQPPHNALALGSCVAAALGTPRLPPRPPRPSWRRT